MVPYILPLISVEKIQVYYNNMLNGTVLLLTCLDYIYLVFLFLL